MILFGCLLAFGAAVAPRIFLVLAWIFSPRWPLVWGGDFLLPLLGIIFLPYTTIMYMLVWTPRGIDGWDWLWIILGLFLDLWKYTQLWQNREKGVEVAQSYYSPGASGTPTGGSSSIGSDTYGSARSTGTGTGSTGTGTGSTGTGTGSTGTGTGSTGTGTGSTGSGTGSTGTGTGSTGSGTGTAGTGTGASTGSTGEPPA